MSHQGWGQAPLGMGPPPPYGGYYPAAPPLPPAEYKTIGVFMLVSGIKTVVFSLILILSLIWFCVGAFWFLTFVAGIFEIVVASTILSGRPSPNAKTMAIFGIVSAVLCGNVIGLALEIVALIRLGQPDIAAYATSRG